MSPFDRATAALRRRPRTWLLTGAAGFIGSHLLENLLRLGQRVIGLDNLSTGRPANLELVRAAVPARDWKRFQFRQGSVADIGACREATKGVEIVLHQAGFVSVPLSLRDPLGCHDTNSTGTLTLLVAARDHGCRRFVFASSSAVYGDDPASPKQEERLGQPLSPYGASKLQAELDLRVFARQYAMPTVALRYFNVFGPRQNPAGGYAAVIPQWIERLLRGEACQIHGDGSNTRDFCPVANVVQANLLAATVPAARLQSGVYNIGLGRGTDLRRLHEILASLTREHLPAGRPRAAKHGRARPGDILHSVAEIGRARAELGYAPAATLEQGLAETVRWFAGPAGKTPGKL